MDQTGASVVLEPVNITSVVFWRPVFSGQLTYVGSTGECKSENLFQSGHLDMMTSSNTIHTGFHSLTLLNNSCLLQEIRPHMHMDIWNVYIKYVTYIANLVTDFKTMCCVTSLWVSSIQHSTRHFRHKSSEAASNKKYTTYRHENWHENILTQADWP